MSTTVAPIIIRSLLISKWCKCVSSYKKLLHVKHYKSCLFNKKRLSESYSSIKLRIWYLCPLKVTASRKKKDCNFSITL